jgi:hypothetical protein
MPYHLETGPTWSVIESVANRDQAGMLDLLRHLRLGTPLVDLAGMVSVTLDAGKYPPFAARVEHINGEVFGMKQDPKTKKWSKQPFDPKNPQPTGYWVGYAGDVEAILRAALIRAAEVSLGLAHDEDPGHYPPPRFWPVRVTLTCVFNWYEAWITWSRGASPHGHHDDDTCGEVHLHLLTPGHGDVVLTSPKSPPQPGGSFYELEPQRCAGPMGQWIVTYEDHKQVPYTPTSAPSTSGNMPLPPVGSLYFGDGKIVTVQPSEAAGGVRPFGRPYVQPR